MSAQATGGSAADPAVPALPPRLAERFVLGEVVARDERTVVLRARDGLLDRPAAVTFHLPRPDGPDAEARSSGVAAVARLDHPHLVPVYDVDTTDDGTVAVVTSWCAGGDLADRIDTGALGTVDALAAVAAVADALDHVHRRGLVHGALSPRAVLLDDDGRTLLADAGTAALSGRTGAGPADDVRDLAGLVRRGLGTTPVPVEAAGLVDAAEGDDPTTRPSAAELTVGLRRAAYAAARAEQPVIAPGAAPTTPRRGRAPLASRSALLVAGAALSALLAGTVVVAVGWSVQAAPEGAPAAAALPPPAMVALPPPATTPDPTSADRSGRARSVGDPGRVAPTTDSRSSAGAASARSDAGPSASSTGPTDAAGAGGAPNAEATAPATAPSATPAPTTPSGPSTTTPPPGSSDAEPTATPSEPAPTSTPPTGSSSSDPSSSGSSSSDPSSSGAASAPAASSSSAGPPSDGSAGDDSA